MSSHVSEPNSSSYVLKDDAGRQYVVSDNTNGDVVHQTGDKPYPEMTKEHLLRHSGKPLWRTLRTISIVIIVLGWIALIAATIAIIVIHPRCKQSPSVSWWQKSVVYRVYVRSFKDSDEDGIGDLKGVTNQLEYLKDLGVSTISLSPFYEQEENENEFSVLNHTQIDRKYGTMEDFQELVDGIHENGMKLVVDFIPGTTSKKHMWFTESKSSGDRSNTYRNYYVWQEGADLPNNWLTVYSGIGGTANPAWTMDASRNSSYLHQFLETQPSVNLRNYQVQLELENILRFWIDNGVDGFYIRNSAYLFVDYDLRDDELKTPGNDENDYESYNHNHTFGLPEINDMFSRWRYLVNSHANTDNSDRFLMADIRGGTIQQTMSYYGRFGRDGVDISLNYDLLDVTADCNGTCVKERMDSWFDNIPSDRWLTWMVGIEDTQRLGTNDNSSLSRSLTMLTMTLPGTPVTYYGNEIGMSDLSDTELPPGSRWSMAQPMRSPMQWRNVSQGGFIRNCTDSCGSPWIPVNSDYAEINVELQEKDSDSDLAFFKNLTKLRATPTMQYGLFQYVITNDNIVSFRRQFDGLKNYLVVINFGKVKVTHNFSPSDAVTEGVVEAATNPGGTFMKGETVSLTGITLNPWEGVVLSWDYQIKQY